jgi:hypothetical protein
MPTAVHTIGKLGHVDIAPKYIQRLIRVNGESSFNISTFILKSIRKVAFRTYKFDVNCIQQYLPNDCYFHQQVEPLPSLQRIRAAGTTSASKFEVFPSC